jgi:hypothetical protein
MSYRNFTISLAEGRPGLPHFQDNMIGMFPTSTFSTQSFTCLRLPVTPPNGNFGDALVCLQRYNVRCTYHMYFLDLRPCTQSRCCHPLPTPSLPRRNTSALSSYNQLYPSKSVTPSPKSLDGVHGPHRIQILHRRLFSGIHPPSPKSLDVIHGRAQPVEYNSFIVVLLPPSASPFAAPSNTSSLSSYSQWYPSIFCRTVSHGVPRKT